ncbi:unnamed protein product, partial [Ectocarpus sp. 12 AP-2014]
GFRIRCPFKFRESGGMSGDCWGRVDGGEGSVSCKGEVFAYPKDFIRTIERQQLARGIETRLQEENDAASTIPNLIWRSLQQAAQAKTRCCREISTSAYSDM